MNTSAPALPDSSEASPAQEMAQLLQMHRKLLAMLWTLIEQNRELIDALGEVVDDVEGVEPRTYLDGTPVKN